MMTMGRDGTRSAVPWWAAFGAPLVGVPVLILLLALATPADQRALDGPAPEDGVLTSEPRAEPVLPVPALMVEVDVTSAEAGPRC